MATTLKEKLDRLPPARRQAVAERTQVLATLRELRMALDCTQQQLAEKLSIGQDSISRLEKRSDMRLSRHRRAFSRSTARIPERAATHAHPQGSLTWPDRRTTSHHTSERSWLPNF